MSNTSKVGPQGPSEPPPPISGNVVPFVRRPQIEHAEPFLTDAERRELREMLVFLRTMRPQFQTLASHCPMARRLLEEE